MLFSLLWIVRNALLIALYIWYQSFTTKKKFLFVEIKFFYFDILVLVLWRFTNLVVTLNFYKLQTQAKNPGEGNAQSQKTRT